MFVQKNFVQIISQYHTSLVVAPLQLPLAAPMKPYIYNPGEYDYNDPEYDANLHINPPVDEKAIWYEKSRSQKYYQLL